MTDNSACILFVTTNSKESSDAIISVLLSQRLAACIQTHPVDSHYYWKGEMCIDPEILMYIKTRKELVQTIQEEILRIHPYEVPQIIEVPVTDGLPDYIQWLNASVRPVSAPEN